MRTTILKKEFLTHSQFLGLTPSEAANIESIQNVLPKFGGPWISGVYVTYKTPIIRTSPAKRKNNVKQTTS